MTEHDAIQFLDNMKHEKAGSAIGKDGFYAELMGYHVQALNMAIKALSHSENPNKWIGAEVLDKIRAEIDAQREKLKIMADDDWYAGKIRGYDCAIEIIDKYKASPTGHWIELPTHESQSGLPWYECSECNSERCIAVLRDFKYCPNCGAKMAESEDVG